MKEGTKYILAGTVAAAAVVTAATAAAYGVSNVLLHMALDREEPKTIAKSRERITGGAQWQAMAERMEQAARKLRQCGCARVEITARDGTPLVGHWFENPNARRVVVAMHGWRSSWDQDFGLIAPFLHDNECSVLYAEQRGQRSSGGDVMTFGLLEQYDCADWVEWVQEHTVPELPVYLAGISMGATTVLLAAGLDLPDCVRGVVADCGFTSPHGIWQHVAEQNLHLRYDLCAGWVRRLCRQRLRSDLLDLSTLDAMKNCRVPVLFVHGSDDSFVPVEMTYENYKACAAPKQLLIVPGAGHGLSYLTEPTRYRQALLQFWQTFG